MRGFGLSVRGGSGFAVAGLWLGGARGTEPARLDPGDQGREASGEAAEPAPEQDEDRRRERGLLRPYGDRLAQPLDDAGEALGDGLGVRVHGSM